MHSVRPARTGTAHVVTTTRKYKDRVCRTHLLRRSYREDGVVKNETLGNLSHLPEEFIDLIRRSLQGETFVPLGQAFEITASRSHGHVQAISLVMQRLDFASLVAAKPCRERDLVLAMNWLLERQDSIQKKLSRRHLGEGSLVLYDLSSSYVEGSCCPVAVSVHEGNVADSQTFLPEVRRLREQFGVQQMVMVGDRGMISSRAIEEMRAGVGLDAGAGQDNGIAWITALKSASIRTLVEQGQLQLDLFDERNLLELSSPDYPGERLVACRNPQLGKLGGQDAIGLRVSKVVNWCRLTDLHAQARGHCGRGGARWRVHHPHLGGGGSDGWGRVRAQLQEPGPCGAGVSLAQDSGSEGAAHSPPYGRQGKR